MDKHSIKMPAMKQLATSYPTSVTLWPEDFVLADEDQATSKRYLRLAANAVRKSGVPIYEATLYCGPQKRKHVTFTHSMCVASDHTLYAHLDFVRKHPKTLEFHLLHEMGHMHEYNMETDNLFSVISELGSPLYSMHVISETKHNELCHAAIEQLGSVEAANRLFADIKERTERFQQIIDEHGIGDLSPEALADIASKNPEKWRTFKNSCLKAYPLREAQNNKHDLEDILERYRKSPNPSFTPNVSLDDVFDTSHALLGMSNISKIIHHAMEYICDEFAVSHLKNPALALQAIADLRVEYETADKANFHQRTGIDLMATDSHPTLEKRHHRLYTIIEMKAKSIC